MVSSAVTVTAGQAFILSGFSQKALWRQLSALWRRLVKNELMTGAAGTSSCVSDRPLTSVSCGQQRRFDWKLQRQLRVTQLLKSSLALQSSLSTRQMFSIAAPSLTARLSTSPSSSFPPRGRSSARRQGVSAWLCGSSHGSFLLQPAN